MIFRVTKYGVLFIAPVLLLAVLFLSLHGLPESVTRDIERQLQFQGMVVSLEKIKLGVFEGVIASRVRCYRRGELGDPVMEAEKIVLHFSPRRWLRGANGVSGGRIKNGVFRLGIAAAAGAAADADAPRVLTLERLQAHVRWDGLSEIRVVDFSADLENIQVTGRGVVVMPPAPPAAPPPAGAAAGPAPAGPLAGRAPRVLSEVVRLGREVRLGSALRAAVVFRVDASDIRKLDLQVQLDSRATGMGCFDIGAWRAQVAVRELAAAGVLEIKNARAHDLAVEQATAVFVCDGRALTIERLDGVTGRGAERGPFSLSLKYVWESSEFEGQWASAFDPRLLLPLLRRHCPAHAWILEAFRFPRRPPEVELAFQGRWKPELVFELESRNQARDLVYHETPLAEARVAVRVALKGTNGVVVTLQPLLAVRPEGSGQGWVRVDMGARAVSFDASSALHPQATAKMIDPFVERLVRQFRFEGPVRAAGWGTVGFAETRLNDMELMVAAQRAGWKMFLADTCALDFRLLDNQAEITDLRGAIYGGRFDARASVDLGLGGDPLRYETEADLRAADFSRLIEALSAKNDGKFEGTLSAHLDLEGLVGEGQGRSARGAGWVVISDGRIFQIPLFGGLSDFLTRIIPGLSALLRQTDVKAEFVIRDGKIHADEVLIEGDVLSLVGKGDYALDGTLDFKVQVKLLRKHTLAADVFRFMTQPVSKMFEFQLSGTVAEPRWRPVNIPKEVFLIFD